MSAVGENALNGIEENIEGEHTFIVDLQRLVIAEGMMVMVWEPGKTLAFFHKKSTGQEGVRVSKGYKVRVYNAKVVFIC